MQFSSCFCLSGSSQLFHIAVSSLCGFVCDNSQSLIGNLCCNTNPEISAHPLQSVECFNCYTVTADIIAEGASLFSKIL